ncbi:methyl-accepting chemotaxis protein [Azospira restricta]|uniref:Methyl-accepting chemotaxis protein n=1 Tax=Azospira restricta TaxID=404405 RepID=A0A974SS82_9RHOO|nr:methyl-accepting chemotaxis protein [Azospira restricta]QRJ65530.1 methyl-accepting chemotaxis protein [Azospira restricta]
MLGNMKLRSKIVLLVLAALVGMASITVFSALAAKRDLTEGRKELIKSMVEAGYNILEHYQGLEAAGKLSKEEAQRLAAEAVKVAKYGGADGKTEYLYAWTMQGVGVVHPKAEIVGQNMLEKIKDGQGRYTIKDLIAAVQTQRGAYVDTAFPRPGGKEPLPKLQYVMHFQPWGWLIGTGLYMDDLDAAFRTRVLGDLVVAAIALLVIGGVGFVVARSVLGQVGGEPGEAIDLMARAAAGDLTVDVRRAPKGSMLASFGEMLTSLRSMVTEIHAGSNKLIADAERINSAAKEVAQASQQQADATSAMAAAIEQMTVSINHISDTATETERASERAASEAAEGEQQVQTATAEINKIATSVTEASHKIRELDQRADQVSSIAQVIKEIAGQTNLLALNAAIEAARAGEQGRGFAVVADEVRKLAERTSAATVEIEQMISGIQNDTESVVGVMDAALPQVEAGVHLAEGAAKSLRDIREGASQTLTRIREVADSTKEQSVASTSIAQQVEHIAQMVEETSAAMNATAGTASELESLASELNRLVGRFRC